MNTGNLYIVATPIGNLSDITLRALETLKSVDLILCEDTRTTINLLNRYQVDKKLISYHQHSGTNKIRQIKNLLAENTNIALVTDAGTPGISDPGNLLIAELIKAGIKNIIPVPGANAAIAALSVSGFPTDKFVFMGFPPHKNKRQKFFKTVAEAEFTAIFYESGHRIQKCLNELETFLEPMRKIIICRELTKMHETIYRGTASHVKKIMQEDRGEFIVVVAPH